MASEWVFFWVCIGLVGVSFGSWLAFARCSMARVERQMAKDKMQRPCTWDGPGARVVLYAYAFVLPEGLVRRINPMLIDALLVRRYATAKDRWLALALLLSGHALIALGFYGAR
jgi:hypothetical protein